MKSVDLRSATVADKDIVHILEQCIFPEDPWTLGMIAQELTSPYRYYVLAALSSHTSGDTPTRPPNVPRLPDETRVVGYGGISLGVDADIMTVGVLPDARGHGIGERIVERLVDRARQAGTERIFLEVRESNHAAQALYEKLGFERIGRVRGYFHNPQEDAITMRRTLLSESNVS